MPPKKDAHDLQEGDEVSWKWGSNHPSGTVKEVVDGDAEVTTKRGSKVSKDGDKSNPAVKLDTGKSDAVKSVSTTATNADRIRRAILTLCFLPLSQKAKEIDGVKPA